MFLQSFDVETGLVSDDAVAFNNAGNETAVFLTQEFGDVIADVAEPLNNHTFTGK